MADVVASDMIIPRGFILHETLILGTSILNALV